MTTNCYLCGTTVGVGSNVIMCRECQEIYAVCWDCWTNYRWIDFICKPCNRNKKLNEILYG